MNESSSSSRTLSSLDTNGGEVSLVHDNRKDDGEKSKINTTTSTGGRGTVVVGGGTGEGLGATDGGDIEGKVRLLRAKLECDSEAKKLTKPKDLKSASLLRFLRARDGDVEAAFVQTKSVLKWRKEHKVDLILERDYEFVAQDRWGMAYWHGVDLQKRPILVIRGCRHDPTLFNSETTMRYLIWKLEGKLLEEKVDDVVVIFDFQNVTRHNLDMKLIRILIPLLLNFYPERLGVCIVYPTLQIIWVLWKMISKAFDEKTEKKFIFVREQKRDNKFLNLIAADQLQERFGGTSTAEYGVAGLGLLPAELMGSKKKNENSVNNKKQQQHQQMEEQDDDDVVVVDDSCVGPLAFTDFSSLENTFDTDYAIREHTGSLVDEDDEFREFLEKREQEIDRFQIKLRYQVSHYRLDSVDRQSDYEDDDDEDDDTWATKNIIKVKHKRSNSLIPKSPRSDCGDGGENLIGTRLFASSSVTGASTRTYSGKRAAIKRFIRRHIKRKKSVNERKQDFNLDNNDNNNNKGQSKRKSRPKLKLDTENIEDDNMSGSSSSLDGLQLPPPPIGSLSPSSKGVKKHLSQKRESSIMDKVKFVMEAGASMKKVPRDDPGREINSWSICDASRFQTRTGPDYKKNKQKAPSGQAIYECVCCDVWTLDSKRPHIASYMQLPDLTGKRPISKRDALAPLPELLIVNMMMPAYPPSLPFSKKKIDGPGQSIVMFAKLSDWAKRHPEDPSVQLWSRFVHVFDNDPFRERLKMITRLENPEEINLGRIERALLSKYNGTPWLVRPEYEFHKGKGYFEIDIDYHLFKYFVLSNAMPVLDRVHNAILDCALMIQAEKDQEMPERVLVCTTIRCLNLKESPEIDLVLLDKSKDGKRRQFIADNNRQASFIDRDGMVHKLTSHNEKKKQKESSRTSVPTITNNVKGKDDQESKQQQIYPSKQQQQKQQLQQQPVEKEEKIQPTKPSDFTIFIRSFFQATILVSVLVFLLSYSIQKLKYD